VLSLRVSRDKRGYDHIYLVLEARRLRTTGRSEERAEGRLLYCGRWPSPCRVGQRPFDEETRKLLETTHPDVAFDWPALLKTLQAALGGPRLPIANQPPPPARESRESRESREPRDSRDSRGRRPQGAPPMSGGRPSVDRPMRPLPPRPEEPLPPVEIEPVEGEYIPGEVVLVTAEFEEREPALTDPEFEPVCEADRQFVAAVDFELVTDEIVHIAVPETTPGAPPAAAAGTHLFAEASEIAAVDEESDESEASGESGLQAEGQAATSEQPHDESTPARPHRRRRRRGGRGRGRSERPPSS
jgi:hypothetical protein